MCVLYLFGSQSSRCEIRSKWYFFFSTDATPFRAERPCATAFRVLTKLQTEKESISSYIVSRSGLWSLKSGSCGLWNEDQVDGVI